MENIKMLLCPICNHDTQTKLRMDTVIENFPLRCPKCKKKTLINVEKQITTIVKEPVANARSR